MNFVIPGPWKVQRPLVSEFRLGAESSGGVARTPEANASASANHPRSAAPGVTTVLGKMPDQGSYVLQVKHAISRARPLLHAALLCAPTLVFLLLAGRGPALFLSVTLAVFIEMAQFAFGYGFGWEDVGDLATDGIGIALAVYLHRVLRPCRQRLGLVDSARDRQPLGEPLG